MYLLYNISFNKNLKVNRGAIIKKVKSVLQDRRGWRKLGYEFGYDTQFGQFSIIFVSSNYVRSMCGFRGLSCADMSKNVIYINIDRWRYGSAESKLNLDDYRTYIINHEVGHLLGREHQTCTGGGKVPVMVQQTLGINNCRPNPWPLDWE